MRVPNFCRGGNLNHYYSDLAMKVLQKLGHEVQITLVGGLWEISEEVEKIQWADSIIVQTPAWWMSPPWQFKKYQDEVFIQPGIVKMTGGIMPILQ